MQRDINSIFYEYIDNNIINIFARRILNSLRIGENRNWSTPDQFFSLLDISAIHQDISYINISNGREQRV